MFVCRKGSASVSTSWSGGSAGRLSSAKWWSARSSGWKTSKTRRGVSNQRAGTFSIGWQERQEQNARRFRAGRKFVGTARTAPTIARRRSSRRLAKFRFVFDLCRGEQRRDTIAPFYTADPAALSIARRRKGEPYRKPILRLGAAIAAGEAIGENAEIGRAHV